MRRYEILVTAVAMLMVAASCKEGKAPEPYGPVPTAAQLEWQRMEYYMFVHFGPNTFTDNEWGTGDEDPDVFAPTNLDCEQWARIAREAGMKGIILTAKHHDGFCLWPSKYSSHTVAQSSWRNGKGDVLRELSEACDKYGLKFGVYISPWDRNHPVYGTERYNEVFAGTISEVLSEYGDVFELWFDGADDRQGDAPSTYRWKYFNSTAMTIQPDVVIFSDVGPGCRWVGNERGYAGETNWSRLDVDGYAPGRLSPPWDTLNIGNVHGSCWLPAEADVSIRPGWFYSPSTDDKLKTVEELMDIYYGSVGRNANLLLNVPPDRSGRISPLDSTRLMEFRDAREKAFHADYAKMSRAYSESVRANSPKYAAANAVDGRYSTYWATDDSVTSASFTVYFRRDRTVSSVMIQEYIPLGQRVKEFSVECRLGETGEWKEVCRGTTVGYKRIMRFPAVKASEVRFNILDAYASPLINNVAIY